MSEKNKLPELLSPAGSPDAFYAAVSAGADAVYLGGGDFNARAGAKNFTSNELEKALYTAYENNVKVYITLNTLVGDLEIPKAADFAYRLHTMGADGFITQDFGLAKYLRECIPDIELHASTQMAAHNTAATQFLAENGFSRMVICREISRENLKELCKNSPIEIEMFVHGAICVCQSGQCLMSSFIGRRSGNRGECAQPCRLNWSDGKARLSIPDMCLAPHIPEICDMGVSSLKIEGRMKSPEYVFGVTSVYRRLLDEHRSASAEEIRQLKELFSRGFTDGYYIGRKIPVGAVRTQVDKALSAKAQAALGPKVSAAISKLKAITPAESAVIPDFSPIRAPKTARGMKKIKKTQSFGLRIIFSPGTKYSEALLSKLRGLDYGEKHLEGIYFPLSDRLPKAHELYGVVTPAVVFDSDAAKFDRLLQNGTKLGYKKCLVKNVSHIFDVENADYSLHGAMELNIYNSESIKAWRERGFSSVTLSSECLSAQIRDMDKYKISCGVVIYGRLALMTTKICTIGDCEKCLPGCTRSSSLRDRTGAEFPVFADGFGHNIIYNSVPLSAADRIKSLCDCGVSFGTMLFTDESEAQVINIVKSFIKGENPDIPFTRGYLK